MFSFAWSLQLPGRALIRRFFSDAKSQPFFRDFTKRLSEIKATSSGSSDPAEESRPKLSSAKHTNADIRLFSDMGLKEKVLAGLNELGFAQPMPVQKAAIPRLLSGENLVLSAGTGSGKTLAYVLPVIQRLLEEEDNGYIRTNKRPRAVILVPTRELARQVLGTIKSLAHHCKVASTAVLGGEEYTSQKKNLDRLLDIVVASPGRLVQHKEKGNLYLSHVRYVVIDEVDTMMTQGFGSDVRTILHSVTTVRKPSIAETESDVSSQRASTTPKPRQAPTQVIMATATLTKAVRQLLFDVDGNFNMDAADGKLRHLQPTRKAAPMTENNVSISVLEVDGVHRSLPNVKHVVEESKGSNKLQVLDTILSIYKKKQFKTLVFCNTVDSCRAVDHALSESGYAPLSYHGDLSSSDRESNLDAFRSGEANLMVCTDIAARGLDIPEIDHVIMFDFPLNPVDYLHRAGRCGRAGREGLVTAIAAKRDLVLSNAIQGAIQRGLPIDSLSSSKRDYTPSGKFAAVLGIGSREKSGVRPTTRNRVESSTKTYHFPKTRVIARPRRTPLPQSTSDTTGTSRSNSHPANSRSSNGAQRRGRDDEPARGRSGRVTNGRSREPARTRSRSTNDSRGRSRESEPSRSRYSSSSRASDRTSEPGRSRSTSSTRGRDRGESGSTQRRSSSGFSGRGRDSGQTRSRSTSARDRGRGRD